MRLPRARATSGECAVPEPVSTGAVTNGVARVLTPLSSNGSSGDQLVLPFTSVDSLNSGLTRTTPTLTPTTLRNIEETFMAFDRGLVAPPVPHQHQAGFVTPQVSAGAGTFVATDQSWQQRRPASATPTPPPSQELSPRAVPQQGHTRGGRRPKDDEEISPEEEQRRRVRRERNKQAAARCRRRRLDLTNTLQLETEELEDERSNLEREIQQLQAQKEELKFLLDAHRPCCKLGRDKENALKRRVIVKPEPSACRPEELQLRRPEDSNQLMRRPDDSSQLQEQQQQLRRPQDDPQRRQENQLPQHLAQPLQQKQTEDEFSSPPSKQPRPTTLSVAPFATVNNMHKDVPINTPSQGLGLNFDSLMQGGTGLTPVSGTALPPLVMPPGTTPALVTPVVDSQPDGRRSDMLSPGVKELVSL